VKRKHIFEAFTEEWPPLQPGLLDGSTKFVEAGDIPRIISKTDLKRSWRDFVSWIGFSELVRALERKAASIDQSSLRIISENIFSIEIGLLKIIRRWSTLRKLGYPKDTSIYNAYSFIQSCMVLKRGLPAREAEQLKKRVISGLLPSGRLADFDLELQIWRSLSPASESIVHFGVLGEPGPDFLLSGGGFDIEIEGKCVSPETGMPLSYGLVSSLMREVSGCLKGRYPGRFVTIEAEVRNTHPTGRAVPVFRAQIEQTYKLGQDIVSSREIAFLTTC
jgi:hypothetical protein